MTIYICNDIQQHDEQWFLAAEALLPQGRRAHALRYRKADDRMLCAAAYLLLRHAVAEQTGERSFCEDLAYTAGGKPYVAGRPGLHFSLSHSHGVAVCAAGSEPVGVDVELIAAYDGDLAAYCCNSDELKAIEQSADRGRAFTEIWTRKESAIKLSGAGAPASLKHIEAAEGKWFSTTELDGYVCTVCTDRATEVSLRRISAAELIAED